MVMVDSIALRMTAATREDSTVGGGFIGILKGVEDGDAVERQPNCAKRGIGGCRIIERVQRNTEGFLRLEDLVGIISSAGTKIVLAELEALEPTVRRRIPTICQRCSKQFVSRL